MSARRSGWRGKRGIASARGRDGARAKRVPVRDGKERHTIPEDIGGGEGEEEMVKVLDGGSCDVRGRAW